MASALFERGRVRECGGSMEACVSYRSNKISTTQHVPCSTQAQSKITAAPRSDTYATLPLPLSCAPHSPLTCLYDTKIRIRFPSPHADPLYATVGMCTLAQYSLPSAYSPFHVARTSLCRGGVRRRVWCTCSRRCACTCQGLARRRGAQPSVAGTRRGRNGEKGGESRSLTDCAHPDDPSKQQQEKNSFDVTRR